VGEVVQERAQADLEPVACGRRVLDHREHVLVERQMLARAVLDVPGRGGELRQQVLEHAAVAGEPERLRGLGAEQQLRELAHPVAREPAADPLGRDVVDLGGPLAHLAERVLVRVEVELGDEAEPAHDPERVVAEARGRRRAKDPALEVGPPAERVEQLAGLEPPGHRVHREVAALHVLGERDRGVGDDLEVVPAGPGRALDARRRELEARGLEGPHGPIAREQADADPPIGDDEVLDAPVGLERGPELGVADPGDDEVELA
jgi:hypothetical protein